MLEKKQISPQFFTFTAVTFVFPVWQLFSWTKNHTCAGSLLYYLSLSSSSQPLTDYGERVPVPNEHGFA